MVSFSFQGESGRRYEYLHMDASSLAGLPLQGGLFIFASGTLINPVPIVIEIAHRIKNEVNDSGAWTAARRDHGVTLCFIHIDPAASAIERESEMRDLRAYYRPPLLRAQPE